MRPLPFPLPPLAEQKRIVAKVDELMALCDRLEAQQQEREQQHTALSRASLARFADAPTPANLQLLFHKSYTISPADLRKSILTLAVQGKLVAQDPNDEPAEEVLARIAATKRRLQKSGEIAKEKPFEPLQSDNQPFEAPESWRWAKLVELTELITKGSSPKWQGIAYVSESEGILFITSENVGNYVLRKIDDLKYVSKGFNEIEARSILKRGDILMNLVGASIGRTAVYDLHDGANINQAVALIRLVRETDGVCPRFLLYYLNSPSAIAYMLSSRVVNAQPNISLTDAREFAVPIPPLAEQRRIVAKVDQLMALVDALETQLTASRATAKNLLDALVAELTNGSQKAS
jgi:type I restriction enzyme S subunit